MKALIFLVLLFRAELQVMASEEEKLRSKVIHYSVIDFAKYSPECKHAKGTKAEVGISVSSVFPASEISAIEINGDEIVLPTSIVLKLISLGQFSEPKTRISVQSAPSVRIRLKNGDCVLFNVLIDPKDMSVAYANSAMGIVSLPDECQCKSFKQPLRVGMTRSDLQKLFVPDGGIYAPFYYERYVSILEPATAQGQKVKVNFAFKPGGMTDEVYYLGKWQNPKSSDSDIVMRLSPPYREVPYHD
jgi:hypothetical protein